MARTTGTSSAEVARTDRRFGFVVVLPYLPMEHVEDAVIDHWGTQTLPEDFVMRARANVTATLDDTNASARLLHEQLTAELAKIDVQ